MAGNSSSLTFKLLGKDVSASKAFDAVGKSAGRFADTISVGAFAASAAIGAFAAKSISSASDLNETLSKTSVLFGGEAASLIEWSKTAATTMGASQQEALDAASTFAIFGKSAGLAGGDLTKFAEQNAQLAGDMASFFNTSPEDAIDAIGAAFRGEMEPIRRYGVLLDDASLRQQALSMGLIKTTKTALTPQQKVLAAQALIMKQTSAAQGDFARTSGGLANQQRIMKAQFENATAAVGTMLLPVLTSLANFATSTLIPAVQGIVEWVTKNTDVVVPLVAAIGAYLAISKAAALAEAAFTAIKVAGTVATEGATVSQWSLNAALSANPIGLVVLAVAALVGAIVLLYNKNETFRNFVNKAWAGIQVAVKKVADFFMTYLWPVIKTAIGYVIAYYSLLWTAFTKIVGWIVPKVQALGGVFQAVGEVIYNAFKTSFNGIAMLWNNTVGRLSFHVPDWVPKIGGNGFDVPDIPMLASGGIVTRPTLALIGERGPEAVVPLNRGAGLGGPTIVINGGTYMGTNKQQVGRFLVDAWKAAGGSGVANVKFAR